MRFLGYNKLRRLQHLKLNSGQTAVSWLREHGWCAVQNTVFRDGGVGVIFFVSDAFWSLTHIKYTNSACPKRTGFVAFYI